MSTAIATKSEESGNLVRVVDLLGGPTVLRQTISSAIDAHEMLISGMPGPALAHLIIRLGDVGKTIYFERAIGLSHRTVQRRKEDPERLLTPEQSGRAWKFAEVFAKAAEVFGTEDEARRWLEEPAMALDQRRPIDLLASPAGTELVENLLLQLEYGVYV
ncbi:MAG TPA: antitoxin Xre/MbcA/ParS toxin-binding domain-containing protein [Devosia sp.]|jgi:putative toxin-antitoxin system antitoxin component (TIGR02293 family)|uniref:type II RES/Xre toxin-antitoxin system antitoxin n=1 Tax=Devosia sp. TaxID=1871048 RepID=UPI002DDDB264|nr:antitoxin Xre/MbcA/ParS toxin-binding domain-containing protein [Devosia sp.]HEV2515638.1 antitoxin Xre/MbcA/ParS toxin-binding domain-containing protein [Devosia sp.]